MAAVDQTRGFTLVEAVIVAVVIAVILAVTIPWMLERERERLQVLADTEPWEVFKFSAMPVKATFNTSEDIVVRCELENLTNYPLTYAKENRHFALLVGNTNNVVGFPPMKLNLQFTIGAKEQTSFEVRMGAMRVGTANLRVVEVSSIQFADHSDGKGLRFFYSGGRNYLESDAFRLTIETAENDTTIRPSFDEIND